VKVVVANVTGRSRWRLVADAADDTDGIFLSCTYPDDPSSGPAFSAEGNVDAKCPQECLRATQAASACARTFGPAGALAHEVGPTVGICLKRAALAIMGEACELAAAMRSSMTRWSQQWGTRKLRAMLAGGFGGAPRKR
jgi:hypothetical protein